MSDTPLPDSVLTSTLQTVARMIGDRLPATFDMDHGDVVVAGELDAHAMPDDAVAVRWPLGPDESSLIVAISPAAADQLRTGPPERSLPEALAIRVAGTLEVLAALFDGETPELGEGMEVPAGESLAEGPGDAVSVVLIDAGEHRATVGIRMVVSDELLAPLTGPMAYADELEGAEAAGTQDGLGEPDGGDAATVPATAPAVEPDASPAAQPQPQAQAPAAVAAPSVAPLQVAAPGVVGGSATSASRPRPAQDPNGFAHAEAHPADFASFDQLTALPGPAHSMAMLGEVEMGVTAELGRTRLTVRDVLGLNPGSIIELDRSAGSPVDVVVNGTLIARGEVVVIDEEFGIRITEILGMAEEAVPYPLQVAQ